jgi:predicted nucleotidyltransferase
MKIMDSLGRKAPLVILKLFLKRPSAEMSATNIIEETKLAKLSVINWVKELEKSGILSSKTYGRSKLYSLNKSPVVKQLLIVYNMDYVGSKVDQLKGIEKVQIFLFGSFARGENGENSDIDILAIGTEREIISKLKSLDSRIKVSFYTPLEWSMSARKDKTFFENVEKDKIRLR